VGKAEPHPANLFQKVNVIRGKQNHFLKKVSQYLPSRPRCPEIQTRLVGKEKKKTIKRKGKKNLHNLLQGRPFDCPLCAPSN
jgi:hypothetical protein